MPLTSNVPAATVVVPVYVLSPERIWVPAPVLTRVRVPEPFWITPEKEPPDPPAPRVSVFAPITLRTVPVPDNPSMVCGTLLSWRVPLTVRELDAPSVAAWPGWKIAEALMVMSPVHVLATPSWVTRWLPPRPVAMVMLPAPDQTAPDPDQVRRSDAPLISSARSICSAPDKT